jgi:glycerol kinase
LESIALQSMDVLDAMNADTGESLLEVRVDGGASRNDLLMQFQADVAQVPVVRTASGEATALGAAFLAGLAVGVWSDEAQLANLWHSDRTFLPDHDPERERSNWKRAINRARGWADDGGAVR